MPVTDAEITADEAETLVGKRVKFYANERRHTDDGVLDVKVMQADFPYVDGVDDYERKIRVDLREVQRSEIREVHGGKTIGLIVVIGLSVFLIAAMFPPDLGQR